MAKNQRIISPEQFQRFEDIYAATFQPGAIIIDWYDSIIFDPLRRKFVLWDRIDKRVAPGETTGGFSQTAMGTARFANRRSLGYSASNPTRSERTRRDIKAIVKNIEFGLFDQSVGSLRTQPFGTLEAKDVQDQTNCVFNLWNLKMYEGRILSDPLEFDGLREILGAGTTVLSTASIIDAINYQIAAMMDAANPDTIVLPTAIYVNGMVQYMIGQELLALGMSVTPQMNIFVGGNPMSVTALNTPAGTLPVIVDPFNRKVAGTPDTYPAFILSEDKISYQYVPVAGTQGPDPKTIELPTTNTMQRQYATVSFGALELLGGTTHHKRLNVQYRSTVVKPAKTT